MGSPLLPVIANFFMEDFVEVALSRVAFKAICWICYMDDTVVIRSHGPKEL